MAIQLIYPVSGPLTQLFGGNPNLYKKWGFPGHNGLDFGIPNGTPVVAAANGTVESVSFEKGGYGNFVKLGHKDGSKIYNTYYAHLMNASVAAGAKVKAGDTIGFSNSTGASTGPHLHFGLKIIGENPAYKGYVDPMLYLSGTAPSDEETVGGEPNGVVAIPELKFEVMNEVLNVRNGPGIEYGVAGQLTQGQVVKSKRMHSQGLWIEFEPGKWCAVTFDGVQYLKVK